MQASQTQPNPRRTVQRCWEPPAEKGLQPLRCCSSSVSLSGFGNDILPHFCIASKSTTMVEPFISPRTWDEPHHPSEPQFPYLGNGENKPCLFHSVLRLTKQKGFENYKAMHINVNYHMPLLIFWFYLTTTSVKK